MAVMKRTTTEKSKKLEVVADPVCIRSSTEVERFNTKSEALAVTSLWSAAVAHNGVEK